MTSLTALKCVCACLEPVGLQRESFAGQSRDAGVRTSRACGTCGPATRYRTGRGCYRAAFAKSAKARLALSDHLLVVEQPAHRALTTEIIEGFRFDQRLGGHSLIFKTWRVKERMWTLFARIGRSSLIWFTRPLASSRRGGAPTGESLPSPTWISSSILHCRQQVLLHRVPSSRPVGPLHMLDFRRNRDRPKLAEPW